MKKSVHFLSVVLLKNLKTIHHKMMIWVQHQTKRKWKNWINLKRWTLRCQVRDYEIANYTFFCKSRSLTTYVCTSTVTLSNTDCAITTSDDLEILKEVRVSESGREKGAAINWPALSKEPISEYSNKHVFCMLFPWLYPGGNGDFNEDRKIDISFKDWASQQLHLADGRFAKDKTWCFFAFNYAERRRNMTQGH
jgi:hypothetical protein